MAAGQWTLTESSCTRLQVNAQHNQRTFHFTDQTVQKNVWQMFDEEKIPKYKQAKIRMRKAQELYNLTKDKTDYVWYTTRYERLLCLALRAPAQCDVVMSVLTVGECLFCSFKLEADDMPFRRDIRPVLEVNSHGHASVAFVNNVFVGNLELAHVLLLFPSVHCFCTSCCSFLGFQIDGNLGCTPREKMNSNVCVCRMRSRDQDEQGVLAPEAHGPKNGHQPHRRLVIDAGNDGEPRSFSLGLGQETWEA